MVQLTRQIGSGDLSWREWVRTNLRLLADSVATAVDLSALQAEIDAAELSIATDIANLVITNSALTTHVANVSNPHAVTKTQVGLSNVDNTSDANKPVSTAQAAAIAIKEPGFRNLLINPDGRVDQRAVGQAADDTYCLDRWYVLNNTGTTYMAGAPGQDPNNVINFANVSGSNQWIGLAQIIEGKNCKHLRGKTVTLGGRITTTSAFDISYAILEWTGTEDAPVSDVVNTWTSLLYTSGNFFINNASLTIRATGVFAGTTSYANIPPLTVTLGTTFNNLYVMIWKNTIAANLQGFLCKLQLEEGSIATPFETRPIGIEMALCQRYYAKLGGGANVPYYAGYQTAAGVVGFMMETPVTMRIAPTTTKTGTWGVNNCGQPIIAGATPDAVSIYATVTATGIFYLYPDGADDGITCVAEL